MGRMDDDGTTNHVPPWKETLPQIKINQLNDNDKNECKRCKRLQESKPPTHHRSKYPALEGKWSWMIVGSSFVTHMLTRGTLFATGVLFSVWVSYFNQSNSNTAWIGSIATGSALLLGPLSARLIDIKGYRITCMMGGMLAATGFLTSSLANSIFYLYASYGIITGAGLGFCYMSAVVAVGEYFDERRSMAFGIAASGSGFGTIIMAMLQQWLLDRYDWQGAMIVLAGLSGLHLVVCGALLRPLASMLNWDSRHGKLRLLKHNAKDISECAIAPESEIDFKITVCPEKDGKQSKSSCDSGLETENSYGSETSDNALLLDEEKPFVLKSPIINRLQANERPRSLVVQMSPSLSVDNKMKSLHDIHSCQNSLDINHIRSPAQRRAQRKWKQPHSVTSSFQNLGGSFHNEEGEFSNTGIKSGDAMYLSSLSVNTARNVAHDLKWRNKSQHSLINSRNSKSSSIYEGESETSGFGITKDVLYCPTCDVCQEERKDKGESLFKNRLFLMLALNQFFTYVGVLVPYVHLTERAKLMGVSSTKAAALVSFIGAGNIFGKNILGFLCDLKCCNKFVIFSVTQFVMAATTMLVPIFKSYETVVLYCVIFGFCFGNYAAFPSLMAEYVGIDKLSLAMGYVVFLEGAAAVIGPPLAGLIYDATGSYDKAFLFAGGILMLSFVLLFQQPFLLKKKREMKSNQDPNYQSNNNIDKI